MTKKNQYYQEEFLGRWAAGELSRDELQSFENWLAAHPEEKIHFTEMREIWQASAQLEISPVKYAEENWQVVAEKTSQAPANVTPIRRNFTRWASAVAAAAVILIGFYWWQISQITTISVPRAEQLTHTLPDGSTVILNAESSIQYKESSYPADRQITLSGEAFFQVTPGESFRVISGFASTEVLGTSFNVKLRNNKVAVACASGRVSVSSLQVDTSAVILTAGHATTILENESPHPPTEIASAAVSSWRSGEFYFSSTPLADVFAEIERQFDVSIVSKNDLSGLPLTGQFERTTINEALDIVCLTSGLSYISQANNEFLIR